MAGVTMNCRVCGKPYDVCLSAKQMPGVFRWQEVACSPECGSEYLAKVNAARGIVERLEMPYEEPSEVNEEEVAKEDAAEAASPFCAVYSAEIDVLGIEDEEQEKE